MWLDITNTLTVAFLFSIWKTEGWINISLKMFMFSLMLLNILKLAGKL